MAKETLQQIAKRLVAKKKGIQVFRFLTDVTVVL